MPRNNFEHDQTRRKFNFLIFFRPAATAGRRTIQAAMVLLVLSQVEEKVDLRLPQVDKKIKD
jgi:hypothetical protein